MSIRPAVLLLPALLAGGCPTREPPGEPLVCGETFKDFPVQVNRSLDILLVLDTAPSMAGEQDSLAVNVRRFASVLESFAGGLPDVHIGVITADLGAGGFEVAGCGGPGDDGALQMPLGCPIDGRFIVDRSFLDDTRERNYTGEFTEAFACMAAVGTGSCQIRQPIAAALRALDPGNAANQGFLRDDAYLAVLFITDGDDCSAASPALFDPARADLGEPIDFRCFEQGVVCSPDEPRTPGEKRWCVPRTGALLPSIDVQAGALRQLKPDPNMVIVALVSGDAGPVVVAATDEGEPTLSPTCASISGEAGPALRLHDFASHFPQRNTITTICNEDLSDALVVLSPGWGPIIVNPCLEGDLDRDPDTPGAQIECVVSDIRYPGEDRQEERLIPACSTTTDLPCWRLEEDPFTCPYTETSLSLIIERHDYPPSGTHVQIRCRTLC